MPVPAATRLTPTSSLPGYHASTQPGIKQQAHRLVDQLPDSAGWAGLMEQIRIRQSIEAGLADSTTPAERIREDYGLPA